MIGVTATDNWVVILRAKPDYKSCEILLLSWYVIFGKEWKMQKQEFQGHHLSVFFEIYHLNFMLLDQYAL